MTGLVDRLQRRLAAPLPGHDRFLELSGYKRPDLERARALDPPPRESAVLALLYPKEEIPHLLLMVRPTYDGVHSGQIAFPGGKREPEAPDSGRRSGGNLFARVVLAPKKALLFKAPTSFGP